MSENNSKNKILDYRKLSNITSDTDRSNSNLQHFIRSLIGIIFLFNFKTKNKTHEKQASKGQAPILSHAILISFAIFLVFAVFITLFTLKTNFENFVADKETEQGCNLVKHAVEKVHLPLDYKSPENVTAGIVIVQMPEKIAGASYRVSFNNTFVVFDSTLFNTTCKIGFNLSYSGFSTGGLTEIKYVRYSNNTESIEMRNV